MNIVEDRVLKEKHANALIVDAEPRLASHVGLISDFSESLRTMFGGLWVGGTASLYETKLVFRPNRVNTAVHADDTSVVISLDTVTDIRVRRGFLTKIIDLVTEDGGLSIRCFGADAFAESIRAQVELLSSPIGSA